MTRFVGAFLLFAAVGLSVLEAFRVRGTADVTRMLLKKQLEVSDAVPLTSSGIDAATSTVGSAIGIIKNISAMHHNFSSGDDIAWGQGGLASSEASSSDTSLSGASSSDMSESNAKNSTSIEESAETSPRQIGTSAFLFVSVPLIAIAAAIASKYGKTSNEKEGSRSPRDLEDNYSTHRMITAASEEEERDSNSPDPDEDDDRDLVEADHGLSDSELDRKLFVQVYKPHRDQSELTAIKNGLAMALNDRGSPSIRGSGRYNLTGRSSYTPDDDSEHNSPFDEPSMPI